MGVLTFMIFWMRTRGSKLTREVDEKVSAAAGLGSGLALGLLAFAAVAREGLETVWWPSRLGGRGRRSEYPA